MTKTYKVKSEEGLHARPASLIAKTAAQYDNDIKITYDDRSVNMKSIMGVMSLGIPSGKSFSIEITGENAEAVHDELKAILLNHEVI